MEEVSWGRHEGGAQIYAYKFAFIISLFVLGKFRNYDVGIMVIDACIGLDEGGWIRRERATTLFDY